jgi:hypothetical protein
LFLEVFFVFDVSLPVDLVDLQGQMGLHLMDLHLMDLQGQMGLHLHLVYLHLMALHWMCFLAAFLTNTSVTEYIVIQPVYRNIVIQPEISTFGFLGCLGYFFLFRLSGLREILALCPFSPQFLYCTS